MRHSIHVTIFFAVIAASCITGSVQGQAFAGEVIWQSGTGNRVVAVAESQDSLYAAVSTEERVYLFNRSGTMLWSSPVTSGRSVAISSAGAYVVSGGDRLLLFDRNGAVLWRYSPGSRIRSVAIDADAHTAYAGIDTNLTAFSLDDEHRNASTSWSVDVRDGIESISIGGEGSGIVAGTESGNICFFSTDGRLLWTYRTGGGTIRTDISHDGSTIAAASVQRSVFLLNRNGHLLAKHSTHGRDLDVSISADGSTLVLADGEISVLNRDGDVLWTYMTKKDTRCVSISSDTTYLIAGGVDGTVLQLRLLPEASSVGQLATPTPDALPAGDSLQKTAVSPTDRTPQTQEAAPAPAAPLAVAVCLAMLARRRTKGAA
jgi:outer membrane protein assembly factor BamB